MKHPNFCNCCRVHFASQYAKKGHENHNHVGSYPCLVNARGLPFLPGQFKCTHHAMNEISRQMHYLTCHKIAEPFPYTDLTKENRGLFEYLRAEFVNSKSATNNEVLIDVPYFTARGPNSEISNQIDQLKVIKQQFGKSNISQSIVLPKLVFQPMATDDEPLRDHVMVNPYLNNLEQSVTNITTKPRGGGNQEWQGPANETSLTDIFQKYEIIDYPKHFDDYVKIQTRSDNFNCFLFAAALCLFDKNAKECSPDTIKDLRQHLKLFLLENYDAIFINHDFEDFPCM